jgi:hypothetical protein
MQADLAERPPQPGRSVFRNAPIPRVARTFVDSRDESRVAGQMPWRRKPRDVADFGAEREAHDRADATDCLQARHNRVGLGLTSDVRFDVSELLRRPAHEVAIPRR